MNALRTSALVLLSAGVLLFGTTVNGNDRFRRPATRHRAHPAPPVHHPVFHGGHLRGHHGAIHHRDRHQECGCFERFVPAHYETRQTQVWVPGCYRRVWVPARDRNFRIGGFSFCLGDRDGRYQNVWTPGHFRTECHQVLVPGRFVRIPCRSHR